MEISSFSCSLEEMVCFLVQINKIRALQFVIYGKYCTGQYYNERLVNTNKLFPEFRNIEDLIKGKINFKEFSPKKDYHLGITSLAKTKNGEIFHIPMIDFECPCSGKNILRVAETIKLLRPSGKTNGFILESGQSYHYYGIDLLSVRDWLIFMNLCKKVQNVDEKWPELQLKRGYSTLRVSISSQKPHLPKVVAKIGDF